MANTGNVQVNIQTLNTGITAMTATGDGTATTTFSECVEAILLINCVAVAGSGIITPVLGGSTDGGTTYTTLVPTTGTAMANVSATGIVTYRFKNLPPKVRLSRTLVSGTSVTAGVHLIGLIPQDSANATSV